MEMTENQILSYLRKAYPRETTACEWKQFDNLTHSISGSKGNDLISYVSAIANMNGGFFVMGVEDGLHSITGIKNTHDYTPENLPFRLTGNCTNLSSEGLSIEELIASDSSKKVWIVHIPKHQPRKPVYAHKTAWQRQGDSLTSLTKEREQSILHENLHNDEDWSAMICLTANLEDLDPAAILKARENYKSKYPEQIQEVDEWNDITFLNKAKITIKDKITNTALILLGKPESEHFLTPAIVKIRWILKDEKGSEKDYRIYSSPLLLNAEKIYQHIRNLKYRYLKGGSLFPEEIDQYEPYIIREAMNNCIAHQDYTMGGYINLVEKEDGYLIFTNLGRFIPGSIDKVIRDDAPEEYYRNKFLVTAMFNLKMVDTIGSGIRRIFAYQAKRFFPMPDYDLSENKVKITITGKIIDSDFANALAENADLTLEEISLLDKVQKKKPLEKEELRLLRNKRLVEGKLPNIYISAKLAQATGMKADYTLNKAFDKQYYQDLIIQALKQHGSLNKLDIVRLLLDKLSLNYNEKQRISKVNNLIQELRVKNIIRNTGSDHKPVWVLIK